MPHCHPPRGGGAGCFPRLEMKPRPPSQDLPCRRPKNSSMARTHGQPAASASPNSKGAGAKVERLPGEEAAAVGSEADPKMTGWPMTVRSEDSMVSTSR